MMRCRFVWSIVTVVTMVVVSLVGLGGCGDGGPAETTLVACLDGLDNDGNGLIDCKDPQCKSYSHCKVNVDKVCGDGVVQTGERCDTKIQAGQSGACPTGCNDGNACTTDSLVGGGTCDAVCTNKEILTCKGGDGCCPKGCDAASDTDCSASCGNGVVEPKELCDTKIPAGSPGACPTTCNDGNACTIDTLQNGGTCTATCKSDPITACKGGDGCCPAGCDTLTDLDCSPSCGNGILEAKEVCDTKIAAGKPGACPTKCDDGNACTIDALQNGGTCTATCATLTIKQCVHGDGCCPAGCNSVSDTDCSPSCGNGAIEAKETCETGVPTGQPGSCPTSCNDGNACTIDTLQNGATCGAFCSFQPITQCSGQKTDGCCPAGCNAVTDADCSPSCGNGVLEGKETCDTKIPAGQPGACPTSCDDGKACTIDTLQSGGTCGAYCANQLVTQCSLQSDGCCPAGCSIATDADCTPVCGNGVVEANEVCDTAILPGVAGACPLYCPITTCSSGALTFGGTCQAYCASMPGVCGGGNGACSGSCTNSCHTCQSGEGGYSCQWDCNKCSEEC